MVVTPTYTISTFDSFWYTVPHWHWGFKQLTKQKTEENVIMKAAISLRLS